MKKKWQLCKTWDKAMCGYNTAVRQFVTVGYLFANKYHSTCLIPKGYLMRITCFAVSNCLRGDSVNPKSMAKRDVQRCSVRYKIGVTQYITVE